MGAAVTAGDDPAQGVDAMRRGLDIPRGATDDMPTLPAEVFMPHSVRRAGALALPFLLALAPSSRAQFAEAQPGARVRVEAPGIVAGRYVGTVLTRDVGMVRLGSPNAQPLDVPIDRITSIEISRGKSRWAGVGRGAVIGTPIGLVSGLLLSATDAEARTFNDEGRLDTLSRGEVILGGAFAGAIWGGIIGAFVPKERWERFALAPRSGFDSRRRRLELGMELEY